MKEKLEGAEYAMAEQYRVTLYSQMGPREGTLTIDRAGTYVSGSLRLMGYENEAQGVRSEDGAVHLFHTIQTAVSAIPCETVLELREGLLKGVSTATCCRIRWEGVLLSGGPSHP